MRGGHVRVGGFDVRDLTQDSLRASIGLVLEESFLFSDTVAANIAFGRPDATREQVIAAARAAEADEFIACLPQGYDTVVGEQGLTLSGGQRQRVALARALLTDPRILVLDDATSAVDPRVEADIHQTLRRVMEGRTTLLIAHRRSTLRLGDRIAVLDEGRLVAEGSHDELMAGSPLYRLLLAGPGDDAEGIGAGDLDSYQDATDSVAPGAAGQAPATVIATEAGAPQPADGAAPAGADAAGAPADRMPADRVPADRVPAVPAAARPAAPARPASGTLRTGAATGFLTGVPASPELLAKVDALPPATEKPGVDDAAASAPDPHFTLRRLLRPFLAAFAVGLVLDGLDALANLAMPALVRGGIDNGIEAQMLSAILAVSAAALLITLADWVINAVQTTVVGRTSERLLYTLRVKIFAHLQRLGLD